MRAADPISVKFGHIFIIATVTLYLTTCTYFYFYQLFLTSEAECKTAFFLTHQSAIPIAGLTIMVWTMKKVSLYVYYVNGREGTYKF